MTEAEKMTKSKHAIPTSLEDLEEISQHPTPIKADLSVLEHAQNYHISLDGLESISTPSADLSVQQPKSEPAVSPKAVKADMPDQQEQTSPMAASSNSKEALTSNITGHLNLERVDLPLREVIRKIFWRSSRPIVVISDDKIVYVNPSFLELVGKETEYDVLEKNFFEFVSPEYWDKLSTGIGDVLTKNQAIQIGIKGKLGKVIRLNFEGIYITDEHTFSFILIGMLAEKKSYAAGLYNEKTGLPSYELLQDRIKMSIDARSIDRLSLGQNISALACIHLEAADFMDDFKSMSILKRIFERLLSSLNKHYTLAHGEDDKEFWIYIPTISAMEKLSTEMQYIKGLFETPVEENYSPTRFKSYIGVSTYPEPATSAKKLVEEAKMANQKALQNDDGKIVYFGG